MKSNESAEDYLEAILMLAEKGEAVRSVDIARLLGYKKSSVCVGMKHLLEKGHIVFSDNGHITLTESGMQIAQKTYERHKLLTEWFLSMGISEETAAKDACRVEHFLSDASFEAIKKHM